MMTKLKQSQTFLLCGLLMIFMTGCNQSQTKDAITLSVDGSTACKAGAAYYSSLAEEVQELPILNDADDPQGILSTNVADPSNADFLLDVKSSEFDSSELLKRQTVFTDLGKVYDSYGSFASGSPDDLEKSLANLESAVENANDGHALNLKIGTVAIPSADVSTQLTKVESYVDDLLKQRDLRIINSDLENIDRLLLVTMTADNHSQALDRTDFLYRQDAFLLANKGIKAGSIKIPDPSTLVPQTLSDTGVQILSPEPNPLNDWKDPVANLQVLSAVLVQYHGGEQMLTSDKFDATYKAINDVVSLHQKLDSRQPL